MIDENRKDVSDGQSKKGADKKLFPKIGTGIICSIGLLVAAQIVLERYLSISIAEYLRFKFTFVAQAIAGVCLGPVYGAVAAVVSDLLGCLLTGQPPIPLLSVVAALRGLVFGILFFKKQNVVRIVLASVFDQIVCGIFFSSYALAPFYGMTYWGMVAVRLAQCAVLFVLEILIFIVFYKSKIFSEIKKLSMK